MKISRFLIGIAAIPLINALSGTSLAYELTPHCKDFFYSWPGEQFAENEMIRLEIGYDYLNPVTHVQYFNFLPPEFHSRDFLVYHDTNMDRRLITRDLISPSSNWPNAGQKITYELLEDHFSNMATYLKMNLYIGEEFMWLESIGDYAPHLVTTSPVFFGLGNTTAMENLAFAINEYTSYQAQNWSWGIVTGVSRCRYPIRGRFEGVIDKDYALDESPMAPYSIAFKAAMFSPVF